MTQQRGHREIFPEVATALRKAFQKPGYTAAVDAFLQNRMSISVYTQNVYSAPPMARLVCQKPVLDFGSLTRLEGGGWNGPHHDPYDSCIGITRKKLVRFFFTENRGTHNTIFSWEQRDHLI